MKTPLIADQRTAVAAGVALTLAGAWVLHDAYRGRKEPWPLRLLGLV